MWDSWQFIKCTKWQFSKKVEVATVSFHVPQPKTPSQHYTTDFSENQPQKVQRYSSSKRVITMKIKVSPLQKIQAYTGIYELIRGNATNSVLHWNHRAPLRSAHEGTLFLWEACDVKLPWRWVLLNWHLKLAFHHIQVLFVSGKNETEASMVVVSIVGPYLNITSYCMIILHTYR